VPPEPPAVRVGTTLPGVAPTNDWQTVPFDREAARRIAREHGLPFPVAGVLAGRGLTGEVEIARFLRPRLSDLSDPYRLPGLEAAVERLWQALTRGERVVVFGDYDVDGLTSTALLTRVLRRLEAKVVPFLPHRIEEGYGFETAALERCVAEHRPALIVTVDCGTHSTAAVQEARRRGIDVVVTDHHEPSASIAPARAVVNPKLGTESAHRVLAGVGVAFKLCHGLIKRARSEAHPASENLDLRPYLDFVALGTVADMVPLVHENRVLAHHGLGAMNRSAWAGLKALREVAGVGRGPTSTYHVGFLLGPRLNAAGRLGDAEVALEVLLTDDDEQAQVLAKQLDATNKERQAVEAQVCREALEQLALGPGVDPPFGLVVAGEGWSPGVVGLVASRLTEKFRRPAVVISLDAEGPCRGSGRSIEGFNLLQALEACSSGLLLRYGGHEMAVGMEVERTRVETFRQRFQDVAASELRHRDLRPVQRIHGWLELNEADDMLLEGIERLQPLGLGNPTPVWGTRGVRIVGEPRVVGSGHLKMTVTQGGETRECIGFNMGNRELPAGPVDIAYTVRLNRYKGRTTLQLGLKAVRSSGEA